MSSYTEFPRILGRETEVWLNGRKLPNYKKIRVRYALGCGLVQITGFRNKETDNYIQSLPARIALENWDAINFPALEKYPYSQVVLSELVQDVSVGIYNLWILFSTTNLLADPPLTLLQDFGISIAP